MNEHESNSYKLPATPDGVLPELPEPPAHMHYASYTNVLWHPPAPYEYPPDGTGLYTADQMHAYARAALEQREEEVASLRGDVAFYCGALEACKANRAELLARAEAAERAMEEVQRRYEWVANELLACDYGDNDRNEIGWRVYGWRSLKGRELRIYGPSIDEAIAAFLAPNNGGND